MTNSRLLLSRINKKWWLQVWLGKTMQTIKVFKKISDEEDFNIVKKAIEDFLYKTFDVDSKIELKKIKRKSIAENNLWPGEIPEQNNIWLMVDINKDNLNLLTLKTIDYKYEILTIDDFFTDHVCELSRGIRNRIEDIVNSPVKDARQVEMFEPYNFWSKNECK